MASENTRDIQIPFPIHRTNVSQLLFSRSLNSRNYLRKNRLKFDNYFMSTLLSINRRILDSSCTYKAEGFLSNGSSVDKIHQQFDLIQHEYYEAYCVEEDKQHRVIYSEKQNNLLFQRSGSHVGNSRPVFSFIMKAP